MRHRSSIGAAAVMAAVLMTSFAAQAFDDAKYPDLSGQWVAVRLGVRGQPAFDPTKPWGLGQQAPLTPEYQKILEQSVADQAKGTQGNWLSCVSCLPPGMPAMMTLYRPMEIIVLPETTYIRIDHTHQSHRRIYTDGRDWPKDVLPSFRGNSIVKERLFVDKADPSRLYNEMTLIDNAYTRPWTVRKTYRRLADKHPDWPEDRCDSEGILKVGKETYFKSADGTIMPTAKDQPAPDLRYFESSQK